MPHATALSFRVATTKEEDVNEILKLVRSAYRGDASRTGWTTEADLVADERIDANGVVAKIEEAHGVILLAHDETGKLASCCEILRRDEELAYFGLFAVDPLRQAGGIGRQVLAAAEEYASKTFGVKKMEMSVIWTRDELISWYVRRGYTKTTQTAPFPYEHLVNGPALRDDLYFNILVKDL